MAEEALGTQTPAVVKPEGETPSVAEIVKSSVARRQGEIAESAGLPAPSTETTVDKPADEPLTVEQYNKWWTSQPENLRAAAASVFYSGYNKAISDEYGDLLPTIVAAKENPALRAVLVDLGDSTKKELLDLIADPEVRKNAKHLTKGDLRDFLFGEALTTYQKYANPDAPVGETETPESARIKQLEERFDNEAVAREMSPTNPDGYIQQRGREVKALASQFGQFTADHLSHVINVVEDRYERAALKAGIDTDKDGWQVRAQRAGVKHPGYRDEGARYAEILGKSAPAAAVVEKKPGSAGEAAPRDGNEAKRAAGITALKDFKSKSPAFQREAQALSKRK